MNVMLIGGGGCEHAIAKYIAKNPKIENFYAIPGNGGISKFAQCVNISAEDIASIVNFAKENAVDFAIVAPADSLAMGLVDKLEEIGVKCFGATQKAAEIESSRIFAKEFMTHHNIPTAKYKIFTNLDKALSHAALSDYPIVIKADGLAKGKGVTVAENFKQAREAIMSCMKDKTKSGGRILIEEFLRGREVAVLAFTDGKTFIPMLSSMNHKRAHDGNQGANTDGMGVVAPNFYYSEEIADECMKKIFLPTINALNSEGKNFKGCIYFGIMLTKDGAKVIKYKCCFGDTEAEAVLPLLESDLFEIMLAVRDERLSEIEVKFKNAASCCVILVSGGYPGSYLTGYEIDFGESEKIPGVEIFHSGTKREGNKFFTSGGRVLAVNAVADDFQSAHEKAYEAVKQINFENMRYRTDIGAI